MLFSCCTELSQYWEDSLPWLLLAIREAQASVLMSWCLGTQYGNPELVGWWVKERRATIMCWSIWMTLALLVLQLKWSLEELRTKWHSFLLRRLKTRLLTLGVRVLALLLLIGSPFQSRFSGPFTIKSSLLDRDYLMHTPERRNIQWCHVNLLKRHNTATSLPELSSDSHSTQNPTLDSWVTSATAGV